LNGNGALGGLQRTVELDQKRVAYGFNLAAVKLWKNFSQKRAMFLQQFQRKLVVALRQHAIAYHVGEHDGGEFAYLVVAHLLGRAHKWPHLSLAGISLLVTCHRSLVTCRYLSALATERFSRSADR